MLNGRGAASPGGCELTGSRATGSRRSCATWLADDLVDARSERGETEDDLCRLEGDVELRAMADAV